jgi:hypothetical protein
VADWYEHLQSPRGVTARADDGRLMGEVSHAAGNIIHRLYYWAGVLEEHAGGNGPSREAIREFKESLGELHRLVKRALDLQRPVKLRPIPIASGDVVRSIALRFRKSELDFPSTRSTELDAWDTIIDPVQLDRAIGMLEEAVNGRGDVASMEMTAIIEHGDTGTDARPLDPADAGPALRVDCRARRAGDASDAAHLQASEEVCVALAMKLLHAFKWNVDVRNDGHTLHLLIVMPLVASRRDAKSPRNGRKNNSIHGTIA